MRSPAAVDTGASTSRIMWSHRRQKARICSSLNMSGSASLMPRDSRPFGLAIGEAALTTFQQLDVVGRCKAAGAEEAQIAVQPNLSQALRLVPWRESP